MTAAIREEIIGLARVHCNGVRRLAEKTGIPYNTLRAHLKGIYPITVDEMVACAEAMGLSLVQLAKRAEQNSLRAEWTFAVHENDAEVQTCWSERDLFGRRLHSVR